MSDSALSNDGRPSAIDRQKAGGRSSGDDVGAQCASTRCRMISPGSRGARAGSCQSFQALCARPNATTGHVAHVGSP